MEVRISFKDIDFSNMNILHFETKDINESALVLHAIEAHQQVLKRVNSKFDVVAKPSVAVIAAVAAPVGFAHCPTTFKLQVGDVVIVDSNLEQVKKACDDGSITWDKDF